MCYRVFARGMGSEVVPFRQSDFNPISVADALPPCFQRVFEFRYFNSIQGTCFHALYNTKHSCMVSSPTGSGKVRTHSSDGISGSVCMKYSRVFADEFV